MVFDGVVGKGCEISFVFFFVGGQGRERGGGKGVGLGWELDDCALISG